MEVNMKIESPVHAEHQLDQLAGQFEHWRQTRTHSSARFPQALWDQAVALAAVLPPPRVAKQLRLRLTALKKQMAPPHAAPPLAPPRSLDFVDVPAGPSWPPSTGTLQIELSRADGTRLCIHGAEATVPLAPLVRAFLEGAR
jgi:hypothetical protein